MWTLQSAIAQSVVISTINAAVEARVISSRKDERVAASKILPQPKPKKFSGDRKQLTDAVRNALYASKIVSYAQGMELLGRSQQAIQLEPEFRRHRDHLARRLHHSRKISELHRRGLQARSAICTICCSILISPTSSKIRRTTGALLLPPRIEHGVAVPAFSARRSLTSTVIARRVCHRTCCKLNAISSARTPTSGSISRACFTPNGSSPSHATGRKTGRPKEGLQTARRRVIMWEGRLASANVDRRIAALRSLLHSII